MVTRGRPVKRKKRGDGLGSIYTRSIKGIQYNVVRITLPDGSRTNPKYFRNRDNAERALLQMRSELATGAMPSDMKFQQWVESWLAKKARSVKPSTMEQYSRNLNTAIKKFGSVKLADLRVSHLDSLLIEAMDKNWSNSTIRQLMTNVCMCIRTAWKQRLISFDITVQLEGVPAAGKRTPVILGRERSTTLISASRESNRELIVEFCLKTGMRISEVLDLRWKQVNEVGRTVTVGESKTAAGAGRVINIDEQLMQRLSALKDAHLFRQKDERGWNTSGYVFCNNAGNRSDYRNLQKRVLTPLLEKCGIERLTWHHLRHNAGSNLLSDGVPVTTVSRMLGHADPRITMSIYAHELPEDKGRVAEVMASLNPPMAVNQT